MKASRSIETPPARPLSLQDQIQVITMIREDKATATLKYYLDSNLMKHKVFPK